MFRQFFRLRDFNVARNFAVIFEVKKNSFKRLSTCTSRSTGEGNSNKIFALNFLKHASFTLPDDYYERRETGMECCKYPGKIHLVKDEVDEQRLVQEGIVCQDFERQEALGMDIEHLKSQRICLIQLASKDNAVLWACHQGTFRDKLPPYLLSILYGDVLKVGHALGVSDVVLLQKHYGECVNNIIDTLNWARKMNCNPLTLRAMCAIFLHQRHPRLRRPWFESKEDLIGSNADFNGSEEDLIGSKEDLIASKQDLIGSKEDLIGSKEDLVGSKEDLIGSKEDLIGSKQDLIGSKEDLIGSKEDLVGSKEDVIGSKEDVIGSKQDLFGSKRDLTSSKEDFTDREIIYAATDAWVSLRVYEEMKRTAEVIGVSLSPPLKSTMDVFRKKYNRSNRRKRNKDWKMGKCRNV